jgi:multicomponent Na+:H+ antiporter subunit E
MMLFLLNILLAVLWCFTWGTFDFFTLATGFALAYLLLGVYSRVTAVEGYGRKAADLARFGVYFARVLLIANVQVAVQILRPRLGVRPRIVRFDVTGLTPAQRTILQNAINLTPGSLVVDMSPDHRLFYVHCMYAEDRDQAVAGLNDLKRRLEREVF